MASENGKKRKISILLKLICLIVFCLYLLCGSGCQNSELFPKNPIEIQSDKIRKDIRNTIIPLEPNIPETVEDPKMPDVKIYFEPPTIKKSTGIDGKELWILEYPCKNHRPEDMMEIVNIHFSDSEIDPKTNKKISDSWYSTSIIESTNRLLVGCPTEEDASSVLNVLEGIDDPPFQVRIFCLISEVYADMTFDRETTIEIANILGENIWAGGSAKHFGSIQDLFKDKDPLAAFPGGSLRELYRSRMGLKIGYWDSDNILALIDLLESKGYVKILMNPTLTIVNGQTAKILSSEEITRDKVTFVTRDGFLQSSPDYVDIVDSLEVTPYVYQGGYIGLNTNALIGGRNVPYGIKQVPVVTRKEITNAETRIPEGQALVIGGFRKTTEFAVFRGVPLLKDLPIIGLLFSSEDTEQRAVETIFILIPTILRGGVPAEDMLKDIDKMHQPSM